MAFLLEARQILSVQIKYYTGTALIPHDQRENLYFNYRDRKEEALFTQIELLVCICANEY